MKKFILIDALALIHRSFHALPPLSDKEGRPTNALYGFSSVLLKMLKDVKPDYIAAAFDLAKPTFRDKMFKDYKAHREKTPEALIRQIPMVKEILNVLNIKILEKEGFEADDIIGSVCQWLVKNFNDIECIIVTGDLDTLQLVSDKVKVYSLKKGISDTVIYGLKEVKERYNLEPKQLPDYKGLVGDPSDNIPGVKGIGQKTASKLIQEFSNLEGIYQNLNSSKINDKIRKILKDQKEEAFFSRELSTIYKDIPIEYKISDFTFGGYDENKVANTLLKFGFKSLIPRLPFAVLLNFKPKEMTSKTFSIPSKVLKNYKEIEKTIEFFIDDFVDKNSLVLATLRQAYILTVDKFVDNCKDKLLIGYNLKEIFKKEKLFSKLSCPLFDLKISAWLLNPDSKNLSFEKICQFYQIFPLIKEKLTLSEKIYAAFRLKEILKNELQKNNLYKIFNNIEMPIVLVLSSMERQGIKINKEKLIQLSNELQEELARLEEEIYEIAQVKFNINSPKQLVPILFEKLKLPTENIMKTPKGAISTDETELKKLLNVHPIIEKILNYRELSKLKNTYTDVLPNYIAADGRIHTNFDQAGTATGRFSSLEPNLQNIPIRTQWGMKIRGAFEAERGYQFLSFDFSQIELRIMAHFSKDEHLIKAFRQNKDIHTITAAKLHYIKEEEVSPAERRLAKILNFGILYGLSAFGLSQATQMTREQAKAFIKNYFAQFPKVKDYIDKAKKEALKKGYVETLFGRKRFLPALKSGGFRARLQAEREAINAPLQGTVADLMKLAMIKLNALLKDYPEGTGYLILQIHDELLFEIKEEYLKEIAPKIKNIMENIFPLDVPLKVDVKMGISWGQMEEIKIDF